MNSFDRGIRRAQMIIESNERMIATNNKTLAAQNAIIEANQNRIDQNELLLKKFEEEVEQAKRDAAKLDEMLSQLRA